MVIPDLEVIISKLDLLASAVARANIAHSSEEAQLPGIFRNQNLRDHTQRLKSSADAVLTTASTIVGAKSTQGDGSQYFPTTFSEFGVPLSSAKRAGIEEWTQNMVIGVEESGSTGASSDIGRRSSTSIDQIPVPSKGHAAKKLETDPDLLIVQHSIEMAEQNWAKANYPEAEKFFRLGLNRVKTLRASKQQVFDSNEVLLKIAFTRLHQGDFIEAEELFNSLLKSKGFLKSLFKASIATDEVARKSHAYFGLAQIYLCRSHLADAVLMCQKCINSWRATTGTKANCLYSKSLQLMASVYQAKGDSATVRLYSELAVAEGLRANETTPYMLEIEQIQDFVEIERILSAFNYRLSNGDFNATHALTLVVKVRAGDTVGPGKLGETLTPTSADFVRIVGFLLDRGADRKEPLYVACRTGNLSVVEQLCEAGADINYANWRYGHRTPLIAAAEEGHLAIAEFLCDRGANIERAAKFEQRALHLAAAKGHAAIVELLLKRGALVDARSLIGRTPLHFAVKFRKLKVVKILCNAGADLEARCFAYRNTPLILSLIQWDYRKDYGPIITMRRNLEIVKFLCEAGADISAIAWDGQSALDYAKSAEWDFEKVLQQRRVKGKETK